jgi:site-specific DNA-methyltransferase (adenine-specific)
MSSSGEPPPSNISAGDCIQLLAGLPSACVKLAWLDLPYGVTANTWDKLIPMAPLWEQLRRVGRRDAVYVFTAIQPFSSLVVCSNLPWFRFSMVWAKNKASGHLSAKKRPMRAHEDLLVFYGRQPAYRAQKTTGHAPMSAATRRSFSSNYGGQAQTKAEAGTTLRWPTTVLPIPVMNNDDPEKVAPTQKPEALPGWFVDTYTEPGDLVLDPTMGSGSALFAAAARGRRFVGFDTDGALVARARRKLGLEVEPLRSVG